MWKQGQTLQLQQPMFQSVPIRLCIKVEQDLHWRMQDFAYRENTSIARVVTDAVSKYLEFHGCLEPDPELAEIFGVREINPAEGQPPVPADPAPVETMEEAPVTLDVNDDSECDITFW
jgi:hypothetical protein